MKKEATLNNKEQKRLLVLNEVFSGRMTGQLAADMLGVTLRHTRRLLAKYRREGVAGLAHGNRGRTPANKIDEAIEAVILHLAKGRVERLFGTLQDRLVKELWRIEASNMTEANFVLRKYLPRYNKRFIKPAAQLGPSRLEEFTPAPQHLAHQNPSNSAPDQSPAHKPVAESARSSTKPAYDHPWRRQGRAAYRRRQQLK